MKYRFLPILLFAAITACSTEPVTNEGHGENAGEEKICNTPQGAESDILIVRFDEESASVLSERCAASASGVSTVNAAAPLTRSGIVSVDEALSCLQIEGIERIFPEDEANKTEMHRAGLHRWFLIKLSESQDVQEAAGILAEVAEISKIQYSMRLKKAYEGEVVPMSEVSAAPTAFVKGPFNDPSFKWQWDFANNADQAICLEAREGADINVVPAWKYSAGDPEVIVAIVDEGVKTTHPDLAANMWVNPEPSQEYGNQDINGYNFADNGPVSWDKEGDSGHGTHIAGTIAAVNNNGVGVCGIAGGTGHGDGVRIMSCQVFSGKKASNDVIASRAILYAANHGASILQCSYGYEAQTLISDGAYKKDSPLTVAAIEYFMSRKNCKALDGGLVFFSAGNEGAPMSGYPAAYRDYISVTAFAPDGLPTAYTNFGPGCNIAAPGGDMTLSKGEKGGILSTVCSETAKGEDYGYLQGTSMACPHASGVAALGLSYALKAGKHFSREEFTSLVLTSVYDLDSYFDGNKSSLNLAAYKGKMGTGAIDAYRLFMQIEGTPCLSVPTGKMQMLVLDQFFGESAGNLTYIDVEMSEADMKKLGISEAPRMYNGKLVIKCSSHGSAKLKVRAIAGGNHLGYDGGMGGIEISKEFAILARSTGADNGGWL